MCSLSELISSLSIDDDDMDDCRSECSYYSLPELDETDPVRRVPGFEVKRQAEEVPTANLQPGASYPHVYHNIERLPLRVGGPWLEHPLIRGTSYKSGIPGPARIVVSSRANTGYDVIYHPNYQTPWGPGDRTFVHARYHPRSSRRTNTTANSRGLTGSPWNLTYTSTQTPSQFQNISSPEMAHMELFQSHPGLYPPQSPPLSPYLATQQHPDMQQYLGAQQYEQYPYLQQWLGTPQPPHMQQCFETQPYLDMQQHLAVQQHLHPQPYLDTQQCLVQPSQYYWTDYSPQTLAPAPIIQTGGLLICT